MGRWSTMCAAGLAGLMAFSQPTKAQEPLIAQAFHREVPTRTFADAAITVGVHTAAAAIYAHRQGGDWKSVFFKTAAIRLGMEGAHALNGHLIHRKTPATTGVYVLGQIANSAQVNVMHAKPVLSTVEIDYLLASFRYDNNELSVRPNLAPLLGISAYALSDASFSFQRSLSSGVFVFEYENPADTRFNRLLFESRSAPEKDEFVTMNGQAFFEGVMAVHVPTQQLADIRNARDYLYENAPLHQMRYDAQHIFSVSALNAKRAVAGTVAHEILGHHLNHDLHDKLLHTQDTISWWLGVDVDLPADKSVRIPVFKPLLAATAYAFPAINFEERFFATTYRPKALRPRVSEITLFGAR